VRDVESAVIVGGGVGGPVAALALQRAGVRVEVHEKYPDFQGRATGFSIWAYAIRRLLDLGFDRERLDRVGREIVQQDVYTQDGELMMALPVREVSDPVGAPSMDVDRRRLQEEIVELLGDGVYRFESEVVGVEQDGTSATATLAGGGTATGDLVVAADGIHSTVRDAFNARPDFQVSAHDVLEGIAAFDHPWLGDGHHAQVWGRARRAGIGAVGEGRVRWFLSGILKPDEPDLDQAEIARRAEGMPEIVREVVEATEPAEIVRAQVAHAYPVARWREGRVVLLGDAAHTLSPFAGMGACSAIEDAAQLVELLCADGGVDEALDAYVERRLAKTREIEKHGRWNERLMMTSSPLVEHARDWVLERTPADKLREIAAGMASGE
jgi:FAD-dependent urate hydroxylase